MRDRKGNGHHRKAALRVPAVTALALAATSLFSAAAEAATITLPPISVGAGVRTSFTSTDPDAGSKTNDFDVNSVRLYITGTATEWLKVTFNTEYTGDFGGADNKVQVMDAIARFEFSPEVNIWAGRFLPPSDRANLYGPYYANHWGVYMDGVQDNYPDVAVGRDNGIAYWGDFLDKKLKFSFGLFDVPETAGASKPDKDVSGADVIVATRLQYDFWDAEPGYFLNSTYYGDKDLLAVGAAYQVVDDDKHYSFDLLVEKNVKGTGTFTLESEYDRADGMSFGGFGDAVDTSGWYALLSYLTPTPVGLGKVQVLGKYAEATNKALPGNPDTATSEFDLGYIMKAFDARLYLFYIETNPDGSDNNTSFTGLGLQVQI